jgi:phytoene desaturase
MSEMTKKQSPRVGVIGGGLGGLAAAVRLAHAGCRVVLYEKNSVVGGKLRGVEREGYRWDGGPSLLTMPQVLAELFEAVGERMEDHLELVRLETTCRYRWADGTVIDEDEAFWRRPEVASYLRYGAGVYGLSAEAFLENDIADWWKLLKPANLAKLVHFPKIANPLSLWADIGRRFRDPHLRQLFGRFATYNGSSPFRTPAAFAIIAYVQAKFGGWYVRGGLNRIASVLETLGRARGVEFRLGRGATGLRRVPDGYGIATDGEWEAYDRVVCNEDALLASQNLMPRPYASWFKEKYLRKREVSLSGFVLMLGLRKRYDGLSHHNVFFSSDYRREFGQLFGSHLPAEEPTIYVCASSRTDPECAPPGCDNWFVLVNAPALRSSSRWGQIAGGYGDAVIGALERFGFGGLAGEIAVREVFTPADFRKQFAAYGGAIYGFASHGLFSAFRRPPIEPPDMPGLYFVGGTTHPGGGIPLVLHGGRIVARKILATV